MAHPVENHDHPPGAFFLAAVLFLLALLVRLLFYFFNQELTFYQVSVVGVPFSDAKGWNDLAMTIAEGRGMTGPFGGQRPLYPFLLACVYTWFGPSLEIGKLLNVLASSLLIPFVYLIVEKIFNRVSGIFVALVLVLERGQLAFSLTMMSEATGALFFVMGFYLLFGAIERSDRAAFFMSGAFLALSNLARPLTLFCVLPFSAFIYFLLKKRLAGSRAIVHGLLWFGAGFILIMTPWVARQKAVHGILTISDKTADSFYAATSPGFSFWTQDVDIEIRRLGIHGVQERYRYLMRKGLENLKEHPSVFIRSVSSNFFSYLKGFYAQEFAFVALTPVFIVYLFFLVPLKQKRAGGKAAMALAGGCAVLFQTLSVPIAHWVTLAGMALSLAWRKNEYPFALAGAFVFSGVFLSIGASPSLIYRAVMIVGWIFEAYHLYFYYLLFAVVYQRVFRGQAGQALDSALPFASFLEEKSGPATKKAATLAKGFAICAALFFMVAGARIAHLNFLPDRPERAYPQLSDSEQRMILQSVAPRIPDAFSERELKGGGDLLGNADIQNLDGRAHRKILVASGKVTPYVYRVPGFVDLDHMSRIFFPRPYDRTVVEVEDIGYCILPNRVPEGFVGKNVVVLGRMDFRPEVIYEGRAVVEAIALLEWDPAERRIGPEPLIADHEVHQTILRLLRPQP